MKKTGLLGGSFNPLHIGHLRLCVEMIEQACLDEVQLVPAHIPPHKDIKNILPFEIRCSIIEAAIRHTSEISLNRMEEERSGPSYTYDTLLAMTKASTECRIFFILGVNDLLTMPYWYKGNELPFLSDLLVVGREGCEPAQVNEFITDFWQAEQLRQNVWLISGGKTVRYFSVPRIDISSSLIRTRWLAGRSIRWMVPDSGIEILDSLGSQIKCIWDFVR